MEDNDDQERSVLYCCILCPKSYKHAKSIRRHMTDDHRTEKGATYRIVTSNESREVGNGSYACDHCDLKFTKMEFWTEHLKTSHEDIYPEDIEERNFDDKDQFEVILFPNGMRNVKYRVTHSHEINCATLKFTDTDIAFFKKQIEELKTDSQILSEVRKTRSENDKLYYLTSDDLRNYRESYGTIVGRYDVDDYRSVCTAAQKNESIRFFTESSDEHGEGFQLVLINETQKKWLEEFGNRGVQLDDTFNIVKYNLRLSTIMVIDNQDRYRPAAFFISYRLSSNEVERFFLSVKKLVPSFKPKYLATDEAPALYNGFIRAFPELETYTKRLLCHWHILQTWKKNSLKFLKRVDKSTQVMRFLYNAVKSKTVAEMEKSLLKFLSFSEKVENGDTFARYILTNYDKNREQWATCYRANAPFNTSTGSESWHNVLKTSQLQRKRSRRLDALLVILEDSVEMIDHLRMVETKKSLQKPHTRRSLTNQFHLKMTNLNVESEFIIEKFDVTTFSVIWKDVKRTVKHNPGCCCKTDDNIHCRTCQACPYEYVCSCPDAKPGIVCTHMHFLKEWNGHSEVGDGGPEILASADSGRSDEVEVRDVVDQVDQTSSLGSSAPGSMVLAVISDDCRMKANLIHQTLNVLGDFTDKMSASGTADDKKLLDQLYDQSKEVALFFKSKAPQYASKLTPVRGCERTREKTMREKVGFPTRKKRRVNERETVELINLNSDDVTFCCICRKMCPEGDELEINWLGCRICRIWVHESCAEKQSSICNICSTKYSEMESLYN